MKKTHRSLKTRRAKQSSAPASRPARTIQVPPAARKLVLESSPWTTAEILYVVALCTAAVLSRFIGLSRLGFWVDEIGTIQDSTRILNPAFYRTPHWFSFFLVRVSMALFGTSEVAVRLPSAIAGVLCVPAIYMLTRRWIGVTAAVAASILVLLSPYQIHFAHEARYYSEVTLLSTVILLGVTEFIHRERIYLLVILAASSVLLYGVHPAAGVFVVSSGLFFIGMFFFERQHLRIVSRCRQSRAYLLSIVATGLVVAVLLAVLWFLFRGNVSRFLKNVFHPGQIERTRGVGFTWAFFSVTWRRFPAIYGASQTPWAWVFHGAFMLLGHLLCWRRKRMWIPLFYWINYGLTYLALFLIPADIPFTDKYIIFLYPQFIVLVAAGVFEAGRWLGTLRLPGVGTTNTSLHWAVGLALVTSLVWTPDLVRLYTLQIDPSKTVLKYLLRKATPDDVFLTSGFIPPYHHYARQSSLRPDQFLNFVPRSEEDVAQHINRYLNQNRDVWFILWSPASAGFKLDDVRERIEKFFDPEISVESYLIPNLWTQTVYHLKRDLPFVGWHTVWGLLSPSSEAGVALSTAPGRVHKLTFHPGESNQTRLIYSMTYCTLTAGEYSFSLKLDQPDAVSTATAVINGHRYDLTRDGGDGKIQWISALVPQKFSFNTLRLEIDLAAPMPPAADSLKGALIITRGLPTDRVRHPLNFSRASHFLNPVEETLDGVTYTRILRHGFLEYEFDVDTAGDYELMVTALNDVPAPVLIQLDVDNHFEGFFSFGEGNNRFSSQVHTLKDLQPGPHQVTLYFVNSIYGRDEDDLNRVLGLHQILLRKKSPNRPAKSDLVQLPTGRNMLEDQPLAGAGRLGSGWNIIPGTRYSILQNDVVKIQIEPTDEKTVGVVSPPLPMPDDWDAVYCSAEINVPQMKNFTANLLLLLLDSQNSVLGQFITYPTGYSTTDGWVKMIFIQGVPATLNGQEVAKFAVGVIAYPNGVRPSRESESFMIRRIALRPD